VDNIERVDRYVVASGMFRFWWLVAAAASGLAGWLLWSIGGSLS
jgi:hypothetical protein